VIEWGENWRNVEEDPTPFLQLDLSARDERCRRALQRHDDAACNAITELYAWKAENDRLYCFTHRAACEDAWRHELHDTLGGIGLVPFLGIVFNGADALLYVSEGDGVGTFYYDGAKRVTDFAKAGSASLALGQTHDRAWQRHER
jgi:hypothetical protein